MSAASGSPTSGAAVNAERLRIVIDRSACQGHARCVANVPELFDLGDDGIAVALKPVVEGAEEIDALMLAIAGCPEQAIGCEEVSA